MKRFIILLASTLTALSAVSCNSQKNTADYVTDENFKIYTNTTYPQYTPDDLEAMNNENKPRKLTYALNGAKVELLLDNVLIKVLEFYYKPTPENISVSDFNFDGYEDIFIPYESPPHYGTYYCYVPEKDSFSEDKELNSIGRMMKVTDENTLAEDMSDDLTERIVEYQWIDGKLKRIRKTETLKTTDNGEVVQNIYGYDEFGNEFLAG